jgi:hypothetical protein
MGSRSNRLGIRVFTSSMIRNPIEEHRTIPIRFDVTHLMIGTRSERHAGAARPRTRGKFLAAKAADQMDLRVGALPTEIAV